MIWLFLSVPYTEKIFTAIFPEWEGTNSNLLPFEKGLNWSVFAIRAIRETYPSLLRCRRCLFLIGHPDLEKNKNPSPVKDAAERCSVQFQRTAQRI